MAHCGVYIITHLPTKCVYVGRSIDIMRRWQDHCRLLNAGMHHCAKLQILWDTGGGLPAFVFNVMTVCHSQAELAACEKQMIAQAIDTGNCLNIIDNIGERQFDVLPDKWREEPEYTKAYRALRNKERHGTPALDVIERRIARLEKRSNRLGYVHPKHRAAWRPKSTKPEDRQEEIDRRHHAMDLETDQKYRAKPPAVGSLAHDMWTRCQARIAAHQAKVTPPSNEGE